MEYTDDLNKCYSNNFMDLYHYDCMELLKQTPDKYFDLAVIDPPYKKETIGLSAGYNRNHFNYETLTKPPTKEFIKELFRVSKNQIMWGFNYYMELLSNTDACIIWNKHQNGHFSEAELAWCSNGKTKIFDRPYQKDIGNKIHPTQKPVGLYAFTFKYFATEGMKILDTHFGSGSIAIAIDKANRLDKMNLHLTACEIDLDYVKASVKRINNNLQQKTIFDAD